MKYYLVHVGTKYLYVILFVLQLRRNLKYWRWRPSDPVLGHARQWWNYAITCHLESIRERNESSSWTATTRKCGDNVRYVEAFRQHLENPVTVEPELRTHMEKMDRKRGYEELKALRELAVFRYGRGDAKKALLTLNKVA